MSRMFVTERKAKGQISSGARMTPVKYRRRSSKSDYGRTKINLTYIICQNRAGGMRSVVDG